MSNLFVNTPADGFWIKQAGINKACELYNGATYMGYWSVKRRDGNWTDDPVDVFYQPNPDKDKGHSHYFGLFVRDGKLFITDAASAFADPIFGIITDDGEVIVSRYRHNYVEKDGYMIDGGRDYNRFGHKPDQSLRSATITVDGCEFVIQENEHEMG